MKRLPRLLFISAMLLLTVVALLITGFRLLLPQLDQYRPQLLNQVESITGIPVQLNRIDGVWRNFGPVLELQGASAQWSQGQWQTERISLALDVWQSLLHLRWQFRDLTFHQMQLHLRQPLLEQSGDSSWLSSSRLADIMLRQLDHFTLQESQMTFPSLDGDPVKLDIRQLTWLNGRQRHRAEGQVKIYSAEQPQGEFQVRLDLRDRNDLLDHGTIYLQADNVDLKPWFGRWLRNNTGLESARFSLAAWVGVDKGVISRIDTHFKQGEMRWHDSSEQHRLNVDQLLVQARRESAESWRLDLPQLNLQTDGHQWPQGQLSALWLPEQQLLRIRAARLSIARVAPLLPSLSFLSPRWLDGIEQRQLQGEIARLALDLPLQQPQRSRFNLSWRDLGWQAGGALPGVAHLSGQAQGSLEQGEVTLAVAEGSLLYPGMFRAPLEIQSIKTRLAWQYGEQGAISLWSDQVDVKARSLWFNGSFNFNLPASGDPYLGILGGIRLYDAKEAWRYYPELLMGTPLTDYLSQALQGGRVDNATLIYAGNPQQFPFSDHQGLFQVLVPLQQATFQFDPHWPALHDLAINLNFRNDGLWMLAPEVKLGATIGRDVQATIAKYQQKKLTVDARIEGEARAVHDYFKQTPLQDSVAAALDQLVLGGGIRGNLHLDIPLDHGEVLAEGNVTLPGNRLRIEPLGVTLEQVSGKFHFNNGNLTSNSLSANWSGLPVKLNFVTDSGKQAYQVNTLLHGDWLISKLPGLPQEAARQLSGIGKWRSDIKVTLPHQGKMSYQVNIESDLTAVGSRLPAPLDKVSGRAFPLSIKAVGDMQEFTLSGTVNRRNQFTSQWLLMDKTVPRLVRGIWNSDNPRPVTLPNSPLLQLNLPAIDGEGILALLVGGSAMANQGSVPLPEKITVHTPALTLGGQQWRELSLSIEPHKGGQQLTLTGREINGKLVIAEGSPWRVNLAYLYYNPERSKAVESDQPAEPQRLSPVDKSAFTHWPAVQFRCQDCWLMGQRLRQVDADLQPDGQRLLLDGGLVDTGNTRLEIQGSWQQQKQQNQSSIKGTLYGGNVGTSTSYFDVGTAIKKAPFKFTFDLNWRGNPWQPQLNTLDGNLTGWLGKGEISEMGGGRAGQLLRLLSFDALLRKLRLDFHDTFGQAFYFDSIRAKGSIKRGVLYTDDLLIDGLAADIAMRGRVDFTTQQLDMKATVAPELSTTVGVATAFALNPLAGAAVFAASRVLSPLWNKVSLIRYHIGGSFDQPKVEEILRQPKEKKSS